MTNLGRTERLRLNCAGFLQFQRGFLSNSEAVAPSKNEHLSSAAEEIGNGGPVQLERAFDLTPPALLASREILRRYGNMSSATVMFVIQNLLRSNVRGQKGCAMAFGPGLTAETMLFRTAA